MTTERTVYVALKAQQLEDGTTALPGEEIPAEIGAALDEKWFTWGYVALKTVTGVVPKAKKRPRVPVPSPARQPTPTKAEETHCPQHADVMAHVEVEGPSSTTTRLHDGTEVPVSGYRLWTYCGAPGCAWWTYSDFVDDEAAFRTALAERLDGHSPHRLLQHAGLA